MGAGSRDSQFGGGLYCDAAVRDEDISNTQKQFLKIMGAR